MELSLHPDYKEGSPRKALLIRGASVAHWLRELQSMQLALSSITAWPVPGRSPNTVWGCLVYPVNATTDARLHEACVLVHDLLFIPSGSALHPVAGSAELHKLLKGALHFMHPETGIVALEENVVWETLLKSPLCIDKEIRSPAASVHRPYRVNSFQVKPLAVEDVLQELEAAEPQRKRLPDQSLNPWERGKLFVYRQLFSKKEVPDSTGKEGLAIEKKPLFQTLQHIKERLFGKGKGSSQHMMEDYKDLEQRNQKELDRLLQMLRNDPMRALQYALPLDEQGSNRGPDGGAFRLNKLWSSLSLFAGMMGGGGNRGNALLERDEYYKLHQQYHRTAEALVEEGEHEKAAFVYMKLLKDYPLAAGALEKGGRYGEAAAIYLRFAKNPALAAACYERGNMIMEAIGIYKDLKDDEKAGDLYLSIHKKHEAYRHYTNLADAHIAQEQYLKAAFVYKGKMDNETRAKELLLEGWQKGREGERCLKHYFTYFNDLDERGRVIRERYQKDVHDKNRELFLQVIKSEFEKNNELAPILKNMAHEMIVEQLRLNPSVINELKAFDKDDKHLGRDTIRFRNAAR